ncbi:MAG: hypothetical protein KAK04_11330, partial [Cyclobacteriaceae bacterium]|nr:hypothetical protein [Cyclobacteriaceae bacterium]
ASRIQSIADPGGIYISESIQKSIRSKHEIQTKFLGEFNLKNVGYAIKAYALVGEDLPIPTASKIKKLKGKSLRQKILSSGYTYIVLLALLSLSGWWIRNSIIPNLSQMPALLIFPIDNFTGSDTLDYFMAGMHSSLVGDIGRISTLRVPSKTTAHVYKDAGKSIPEIASELNIDYFLEPSVLCLGDTICLQVKLISAFPEEKQIWMHDYKVERSQIFNMYNLVAKEIFEGINVNLTPEDENLLSESRTVNPDAQEAYFRGMSYFELGTKSDLERALGYFERALDIDPDYALAYLGISLVWGSYAQHGFMSSNEAMAESDKAIKKAMELDSSLVEIRSWLAATYAWGTWEWERAGKEFRRAIEINPNYAFVRASYSLYLALMGNPEEGLPHGELAIKLDPFNTLYRSIHGQALKNARKYDEALDLLLKLYDTEPDQGIGLPALLAVYHELGKNDEALEIAKKIYALKGIDAAIETLEAGNKEGGYNMAW